MNYAGPIKTKCNEIEHFIKLIYQTAMKDSTNYVTMNKDNSR